MGQESRRAFLARGAGIATLTVGLSGCSSSQPSVRSDSLDGWQLQRTGGASAVRHYDAKLHRNVLTVTTGTGGGEARLIKQRTQPVSLRNQILRVWLKVESSSSGELSYVAIKVGTGDFPFENYAYEEILAPGGYAEGYLLSTIKPGQWTPFTIGPPSFVGLGQTNVGPVDYDRLQDFEVAVAGARTRLSFGGMEVLAGDPRYPKGVVSITFDDGLSSPYRLALPVLATHGFPATAYIIRSEITRAGLVGSYLSISQLHDLAAHGWEIAAHANLIGDHNAEFGFLGVPPTHLAEDVQQETAWLRQSGFNGASDLALPQGWFTSELLDRLERDAHFQTIRTVDYRSVETLPVTDPHRLRCRLYDHTQQIGPPSTPGTTQWRVDQIAQYGGWLILGFHDLTDYGIGPASTIIDEGSAITRPDFTAVVAHIARRGVPVRTVRQVWESGPGQTVPLGTLA